MQDQDDAINQIRDQILSVKQALSNRIDLHDAKLNKLIGGTSEKNSKVNSFEKKIEE